MLYQINNNADLRPGSDADSFIRAATVANVCKKEQTVTGCKSRTTIDIINPVYSSAGEAMDAKMETTGDDKDNMEESNDSADKAENERKKRKETSQELTSNEDSEASQKNENRNKEEIPTNEENTTSVPMGGSVDDNDGHDDADDIESAGSQEGPGDDRDMMPGPLVNIPMPGHPFEGKRVRVTSGKLAGMTAPVKAVKSRGWVTLDHPDATIDVAAQRLEFLDEITVEELEKFYETLGRPLRVTPNLEMQIRKSGTWQKLKRLRKSPVEEIAKETRTTDEDYEPESKKPKTNPQMKDIFSHSGLRLNEVSDAVQKAVSKSGNALAVVNMQTEQPEMLNYKSGDRPQRFPRPLPPILLEVTKEHGLPPALRHLDPCTRVDIFNRKTGKVMTGHLVRDLPDALLLHAEYEPIVPPPASRSDSNFAREGRSSRNVRVTNSVTPQSKLEASHLSHKGRSVVVTKGPYRGYIGVIDERTPGGWFVLKDVHASTELGFPLVVGPRYIELIPKKYKATVTEMARSLVKDYNFRDMVTTYHDYLTNHFRTQIQILMDRIKSLNEEDAELTSILNCCQSEGSFSRSPEEIERYRSRQRTVRESKMASEMERDDLLKQSASAISYALHTFEEEEKAEASKELSSMFIIADAYE